MIFPLHVVALFLGFGRVVWGQCHRGWGQLMAAQSTTQKASIAQVMATIASTMRPRCQAAAAPTAMVTPTMAHSSAEDSPVEQPRGYAGGPKAPCAGQDQGEDKDSQQSRPYHSAGTWSNRVNGRRIETPHLQEQLGG